MRFKIESKATFEMEGGREVKLDPRVLCDFKLALFDTKAALRDPALPESEANPKELDWDVVEKEIIAYVKEKTGVDIDGTEARGIWMQAEYAWSEIRKNLRPPTPVLQISQPTTDLRLAE